MTEIYNITVKAIKEDEEEVGLQVQHDLCMAQPFQHGPHIARAALVYVVYHLWSDMLMDLF
jgi:hypothetical protein